MADPNLKQKLYLIDIDNDTIVTLQGYLDNGKVIHQIVNLQPKYDKLLIVYYDPDLFPA